MSAAVGVFLFAWGILGALSELLHGVLDNSMTGQAIFRFFASLALIAGGSYLVWLS